MKRSPKLISARIYIASLPRSESTALRSKKPSRQLLERKCKECQKLIHFTPWLSGAASMAWTLILSLIFC